MAVYFYKTSHPFSNFYPCLFQDEEGIEFNCSEQYFMYQKCLTFDPENRNLLTKILKETNPKKIKALGRKVRNYSEEVWQRDRYDHMVQGLKYKFDQNDNLKEILLETEGFIYEASPTDRIWGIGFSVGKAPEVDPLLYGQNLLGLALMDVRDFITGIE